MISWTRQFSLPVEPPQEAVFDTIAAAHGTSLVSWLIDAHQDAIASMSDGLIEFLRNWTKSSVSFGTVWNIAFGRTQLALKEGRLDIGDVAARVGIRLAECGHPGHWTASVAPAPFMVGRSLIKNVTHVEVNIAGADSSRITLRCKDGRTVAMHRTIDSSWTDAGDGRLRWVGYQQGFVLLARDSLPDDVGTRPTLGQCRPVDAVDSGMEAVFADGLALLRELAPQYVPWVTRAVHGVVVCSIEEPFHLVSGSWEDIPGFIHISSPHSAVDIAEILVHEAAHQYFYLLQRVGDIDDGSDRTLYWSPPIRMKRPLSRILMAFHALTNVLQVYRAVRAAGGADAPYVEANEPILLEAIRALDAPLRGNPALTNFGRGLYEPLAKLLPDFDSEPIVAAT